MTATVQTESPRENPPFLTTQLITYLGNKRVLLDFIGQGLNRVRQRLGRDRVSAFDAFSGSGIVSRYLKQFCHTLHSNDLEPYAEVINRCYLTNAKTFTNAEFDPFYRQITNALADDDALQPGLIADMYAPRADHNIQPGERVFYTNRNARYLDTARQLIDTVPEKWRHYLLAPLLSEASIHANTAGVFKGFYKNSKTGLGTFGGRKQDALSRITGPITLPYPVFSHFACDCHIYRDDSNTLCETLPEVDVAYLDPPYNQHPYGANYFMLNLLTSYRQPTAVSPVSGIPTDWQRSAYNKKPQAADAMRCLTEKLHARFLLISFNSEGFISRTDMLELLGRLGRVEIIETRYNTFRGSRNLAKRPAHVKEYLFLLENGETANVQSQIK